MARVTKFDQNIMFTPSDYCDMVIYTVYYYVTVCAHKRPREHVLPALSQHGYARNRSVQSTFKGAPRRNTFYSPTQRS